MGLHEAIRQEDERFREELRRELPGAENVEEVVKRLSEASKERQRMIWRDFMSSASSSTDRTQSATPPNPAIVS